MFVVAAFMLDEWDIHPESVFMKFYCEVCAKQTYGTCKGCKNVEGCSARFCSRSCIEQGWKYHKKSHVRNPNLDFVNIMYCLTEVSKECLSKRPEAVPLKPSALLSMGP